MCWTNNRFFSSSFYESSSKPSLAHDPRLSNLSAGLEMGEKWHLIVGWRAWIPRNTQSKLHLSDAAHIVTMQNKYLKRQRENRKSWCTFFWMIEFGFGANIWMMLYNVQFFVRTESNSNVGRINFWEKQNHCWCQMFWFYGSFQVTFQLYNSKKW